MVFPPPGLDADNSFFARKETGKAGRLYLGVMGQVHTPVTSLVRLAASLLEAPVELQLDPEVKDAYWTLVIYHNSKRELGKTMTLSRDDFVKRITFIARNDDEKRKLDNIVELSANRKGSEIPLILQQLSFSVGNKERVVDILPCTNMISVGVDVSRLGLMVIVGQPKTTAEYIQASSRVGRSKVPGIVVTLYSPTKSRDRSHYENFTAYHEALYRHVEPTSVTPYAPPALDRALHASLIATMRLAGGIGEDDKAGRFNPDDPDQGILLIQLKKRMTRAAESPENIGYIEKKFESVVKRWKDLVDEARKDRLGGPLRYEGAGGGKNFLRLLCTFQLPSCEGWPTLNSMRNVDTEIEIQVYGEERE